MKGWGWRFGRGKQSRACVERWRGRGRAGKLTVPAVGGGWPGGSGAMARAQSLYHKPADVQTVLRSCFTLV